MKKFYIGIGISGTGKSTFFNTFLEDACYLNADSIREELSGDANNQDVSKKAFDLLYERLYEDCGWTSWDCVIDNTSLTAKSRKPLLDIIQKAYDDGRLGEHKIIFVWFVPQLDKAQSWNTQRTRQVPANVIQSQFDRMEYPTEAELKIGSVYGVTI
jgi:predicted kinase